VVKDELADFVSSTYCSILPAQSCGEHAKQLTVYARIQAQLAANQLKPSSAEWMRVALEGKPVPHNETARHLAALQKQQEQVQATEELKKKLAATEEAQARADKEAVSAINLKRRCS
jgi:hypothetical protein